MALSVYFPVFPVILFDSHVLTTQKAWLLRRSSAKEDWVTTTSFSCCISIREVIIILIAYVNMKCRISVFQIMGSLAVVVNILSMCFIIEIGMDGDRSLVAGRSQREKRRSYKDLLREEEEIAAQVRKSSKKRLKVRTAHL